MLEKRHTDCDGNKENFFTHLNFLVFSSLINATVPAWMAYMKQKANLSPKKKKKKTNAYKDISHLMRYKSIMQI